MNKIKFSHEYAKMPGNIQFKETTLLEVFKIDVNELSGFFRVYDTLIKGKNPFYKESHYQLPAGVVLVLILRTDGMLWTTIRRWTTEKEAYYRSIRGEQIEIVIQE